MKYSSDWVTEHTARWRELLGHLQGRSGVRMLEIGSHEGRSACWFLDEILTGPGARLYCVDPWLEAVFLERFDANTAEARAGGRLVKIRAWSVSLEQLELPARFDAIYIDAEHTADGVLTDLAIAWPRLAVGGVLIFDDYGNPAYPGVATAVNWFVADLGDYLEVVGTGAQVAIRKLADTEQTIRICPLHMRAHAAAHICPPA